MEFKQIQELIKTINKSNISELSIQDGEFQITIKQGAELNPDHFQTQLPLHMMMPMQGIQAAQQTAPQIASSPAAAITAPATELAPMAPAANGVAIKSPMIGTFYRSSGPDKAPFVGIGDEVKKGQVLCVIEAMKLFNEIECEINGRIIKVFADDASPVEYDQPLFLVEPA